MADALVCLVISLPFHLPDSSTCLLAAITHRAGPLDGSLRLLVNWSRAPLAAGGVATMGKDAMVTLTLRAPVHFWRNSVFPSLPVPCLCVAVYPPFPFCLCMPASYVLALVPIIHADLLHWPPARATRLGFLTEGERSPQCVAGRAPLPTP